MARGGSRPGAGRKAGQVTKARAAVLERAKQAQAAGLTPLEYLLSILRDETQEQSARFAAAKEAAPYVHNRLAAVEHSGNQDAPIKTVLELAWAGSNG
jgi:hypothetical protein